MSARALRWIFIAIAALVLVVVAGTSGVMYEVEARHSRAIDVQSHALRAIGSINAAQVVVHQQRVLVASSNTEPLNRRILQAKSAEFDHLMAQPGVVTRGDQQLVHRIATQHQDFVAAALALPDHPTPEQLARVDRLASLVTQSLDELRTEHHTDLGSIIRTEKEQRELAGALLFLANGTVLVLVFAGFVFLDRLSKERSRRRVLEATDQLRNEFVSFAAHELRNPAAMINAGIYLLRLSEVDPEVRKKALDSMAQSSAALGRLVMNLLNMGRIEEGRLHLHREPIPLPALVGSLVEELAAYREGAGRRLRVDLPDVLVDVDPDYARLAISNVLDNAVKYSSPETPIDVTGAVEDGLVKVHIHDQGPGLPPERLAHVFEKWETTETSPHGVHRGTGLGLYMARLLVETHGGRIWAENSPSGGATISFTLPLVRSQEGARPAPTASRRGRGS